MSSAIIEVTANVVRNATVVDKLKTLASAHPIGAAVAGGITVGLAGFGAYKLSRKLFKKKPEPVVVQPASTATVTPTPDA